MEVVTQEGERRFEEKNARVLQDDERARTRTQLWRKIWKKQVLWRGVWRDKLLFDSEDPPLPLKYSGFQTHDRGRPVLSVRLHCFEYLENARGVSKSELLRPSAQEERVFKRLNEELPPPRVGGAYQRTELRAREVESVKANYANIIYEQVCMVERK